MILLLSGQRSSVAADGHNSLRVIPVKRDELTAVLVGGPIAKHGSPLPPRGEPLVAVPAQQEGPGGQRLVERELGELRAIFRSGRPSRRP